MINPRRYGEPPYRIAVVHGGPGAAGEMAPVARELSPDFGILEPLQTELTLEGQIRELADLLRSHAATPVVLVGFSWGAWLALCCAARHPALVRKLVLIGCPPLEEKYTAGMQEARLSRLSASDRAEARSLMDSLAAGSVPDGEKILGRLGELFAQADSFDPDNSPPEEILTPIELYQAVWREGAAWRRECRLLKLAERISCPVVAIHGEHDPHPADGVRIPLETLLPDFRLIRLSRCGHAPWRERQAKAEFHRLLRLEIGGAGG